MSRTLCFEYIPVPDWPPLAWLAKCAPAHSKVFIFHGRQVETTEEWFCEAVWGGDYESGWFDQTDIVAGSGGRLRPGKVTFVSSGSTVDRLHSLQSEACTWVSNSLPCLLSAVGASLDPSYPHYFTDLRSIKNGLHKYRRFLHTSAGPVELIYFLNLVSDGGSLMIQHKAGEDREFTSFAHYYDFLESSMQLIGDNMNDSRRQHRYSMLATISSGYDSAMVTTIARRVGCSEVLTFDRSRFGEDDSGAQIAHFLGVRPILVSREAWRSAALAEVPFIASNGYGEDVLFKGAEDCLARRVLFAGTYGGYIWAKHTSDLSENMVGGANQGLSLTEYRLWAGFIHCPPAFWGARQIRAVNSISNSPELKPWDIRGDYSRPICRRVVEQAGVPRELFGIHKRFAAVALHQDIDFLTPHSWADYMEWLKDHSMHWIRHGRIPPLPYSVVDRGVYSVITTVDRLARSGAALASKTRGASRLLPTLGKLLDFSYNPHYLRRYLFPWAIEHATKRYPRPF